MRRTYSKLLEAVASREFVQGWRGNCSELIADKNIPIWERELLEGL